MNHQDPLGGYDATAELSGSPGVLGGGELMEEQGIWRRTMNSESRSPWRRRADGGAGHLEKDHESTCQPVVLEGRAEAGDGRSYLVKDVWAGRVPPDSRGRPLRRGLKEEHASGSLGQTHLSCITTVTLTCWSPPVVNKRRLITAPRWPVNESAPLTARHHVLHVGMLPMCSIEGSFLQTGIAPSSPNWDRPFLSKLGSPLPLQTGRAPSSPNWEGPFLSKLGGPLPLQTGRAPSSPNWDRPFLSKLGSPLPLQTGRAPSSPNWEGPFLSKLGGFLFLQGVVVQC
ncbi:unnamed protein product [Boreogadus saida]